MGHDGVMLVVVSRTAYGFTVGSGVVNKCSSVSGTCATLWLLVLGWPARVVGQCSLCPVLYAGWLAVGYMAGTTLEALR